MSGGRRSHAKSALSVLEIVRGIDGSQAVQNKEEDKQDQSDDGKTAEGRLAVSEISPLAAGLASVALESLVPELVVDHAAQGDAVAEELEA